MINAGVSINTFNGLQRWDDDSGQWNGIGVRVTYPDDQTAASNPPEAGDYLIETNGNVWLVRSVELTDPVSNDFTLNLYLTNGTPAQATQPSLGGVRSGIITPVNGFMAPYWDSTVVGGAVSRIAAYLSMKNIGMMWANDVPGETLV